MQLSLGGIAMCQASGVKAQTEGEGTDEEGSHQPLDLEQNVFQVHGAAADGFVQSRKKPPRRRFLGSWRSSDLAWWGRHVLAPLIPLGLQ